MNRRDALTRVAVILGGSVIGADFFLAGCKATPGRVNGLFNREDILLFDAIAETILPATDTPGAKAAQVGSFLALMVNDCYTLEQQEIFTKGIAALSDACEKINGKPFLDCDDSQRFALLSSLDKEQKDYTAHKTDGMGSHYFRMIKELTLLGYFTSKIGCTEALRYIAVPGRYDGDIPYKKGDKAWAT